MELFIPLIYQILSELPTIDSERLKDLQRTFAKEHKMNTLPSKSQLLQTYFFLIEKGEIQKNSDFEQLLKKRAIRSMSGIVSVQVLTKPRPCPGECIFCPNDPTMPKSYIKTEPGAMRAFLNQFDPIKQVYNRLQSLTLTGHTPEKIEMIVLGGSRDAYTPVYKTEFIKSLYDACNTFSQLEIQMNNHPDGEREKKYGFDILNLDQISYSSSLTEAIEKNEKADHRIIGLTIETRPDLVTHKHCQQWRELGVTRVEMGVQTTDNEILQLNKRGHTIDAVKQAMHIMRQYGFKISIHLMPGLYGSSVEKDIQTFREIFDDPYFKPDELKFYPTSVIPNTELYNLYQKGEYTPITTEEILHIIRETFQHIIPPYTRIKRLIRDIPATEISAGSSVTNLSQLAHDSMLKEYKTLLHNPLRPASQSTSPGQGSKEYLPEKGGEPRSGGGFNDKDSSSSLWSESEGQKIIQNFYSRLYPNLTILPESEFPGFSLPSKINQKEIRTFIFGMQPDLESYRHFVSLDTRSREVRNKKEKTSQLNLVLRCYQSSVGTEYFISYEDELGYLYGFTRLLLPTSENTIDIPGLGESTAIIRELHVYGELQKIGETSSSATQHTGLGKKLLQAAELVAKKTEYNQLSVISGVGVKEYYFKQGYQRNGTYVSKNLFSE